MKPPPERWPRVLRTAFRVLAFRATREELLGLGYRHLIFGLMFTWFVGIGRWWDDPGARPLQHLGLGSVIYVFALSLLVWLVIWPLKPRDWSYPRLLTFVTLTSPPAILYAIPVEKFVDIDTATTLNVWFLGVVATWRVSLLCFYLRRLALLEPALVAVGAAVPIALVVSTLTFLNLHRVVFQIMGGLREPNAHEGAHAVLLLITGLSFFGAVPLLFCYIAAVLSRWRPPGNPAAEASAPPDDHASGSDRSSQVGPGAVPRP